MLREIEVEGVGIMRHMTEWQVNRLTRIQGPNKAIAPMAFGLGMTFHQFRSLSLEQQKACRAAYDRLTAPPPQQRFIGNR